MMKSKTIRSSTAIFAIVVLALISIARIILVDQNIVSSYSSGVVSPSSVIADDAEMSADQGANIEGREENNEENDPIVDSTHESQDEAPLHETITAKAKDVVTSNNIETESSSSKNDSVQDATSVLLADVDLLKEQNHNNKQVEKVHDDEENNPVPNSTEIMAEHIKTETNDTDASIEIHKEKNVVESSLSKNDNVQDLNVVVQTDLLKEQAVSDQGSEQEEEEAANQTEGILDEVNDSTSTPSQSFPNLRALVVGLENSGTSITSRLIMNAPCIIGAFETGFLIASEPASIDKVDPWYQWHKNNNNGSTSPFLYRLQEQDYQDMKKANNFVQMYDILRSKSHLFNDLIDEEYCSKPYQMVDKTPRYVYPEYFEDVVAKTPNVPVIVLVKPFEKQKESWARRNTVLRKEWYDKVFQNVENVQQKYPHRIMLVQYDELMADPSLVMNTVFQFIGLEWQSDYLAMTGLKKKFVNYPQDVQNTIAKWEFVANKHTD